MTDRYLDDLTVGESWDSEPFTMTEAEIIEIRPSKSQPDRGVVRTKTTVTNQDGDLAMSFENQMQLPRNAEARL